MLFVNKKTGVLYNAFTDERVLNTTNAQDGQEMIIYSKYGNEDTYYVREKKEFYEKFEEVEV